MKGDCSSDSFADYKKKKKNLLHQTSFLTSEPVPGAALFSEQDVFFPGLTLTFCDFNFLPDFTLFSPLLNQL